MSIKKRKAIILSVLFFMFHYSAAYADENEKHEPTADHHALVHPFLTHMGMPDNPGELSTRIHSVENRSDGEASGTYGFHVESGIFERWGLHLRNDAVKFQNFTEIMLQYAVLRSDSGLSGISLIVEEEFPTGSTTETSMEGVGISFAYVSPPTIAINSVVHYVPREEETEWEISFVSSLNRKIFPVLEFSGELMSDGENVVNALAGLKFKVLNSHALGLGYQMGTTATRDYDSRLIMQVDLSFH